MKHKVIVKLPNKSVEVREVEAEYRCDCKGLVLEDGSLIQYVEMPLTNGDSRFCFLCDEEGLIKGLPFNFYMPSRSPFGGVTVERVVGAVAFIRYRWEDPYAKELWDFQLEDVTAADVEAVKQMVDADSALQKKIAAIVAEQERE